MRISGGWSVVRSSAQTPQLRGNTLSPFAQPHRYHRHRRRDSCVVYALLPAPTADRDVEDQEFGAVERPGRGIALAVILEAHTGADVDADQQPLEGPVELIGVKRGAGVGQSRLRADLRAGALVVRLVVDRAEAMGRASGGERVREYG